MEREKSCCFTGHRAIPANERITVISRLKKAIARLIEIGVTDFYAGGALGFDTLAAETVLEERKTHPHIRLILVLPCKNQSERWRQSDIDRYEMIKSFADDVIYTSEYYSKSCMHIRNRYLADHSRYCVCYLNKNSGGTYYTVNYAKQCGLIIYNTFKIRN